MQGHKKAGRSSSVELEVPERGGFPRLLRLLMETVAEVSEGRDVDWR